MSLPKSKKKKPAAKNKAGAATTSMPKPDWETWQGRGKARIWEWLALSVNVDPQALGLDHFLAMQSGSGDALNLTSQDDPRWLQQLGRRWRDWQESEIAKPRKKKAAAPDLGREVNRKVFEAWAGEQRWKLPAGFARA